MEKKRRARINQSLNDLKRLLLESNSVKKEVSHPIFYSCATIAYYEVGEIFTHACLPIQHSSLSVHAQV